MTVQNGHSKVDESSNGYDVPQPRAEWIKKRREHVEKSGDQNVSQMHYARRGVITEEMEFVAQKEKLSPEVVRDEVAAR